ncbi:hypothetical protein BOH78_0470 [Pichia kudriavzevii]|uniref:Uncharacterized protein n=1 Tax=Pichia kudriavzevii TaxID=4909 RepID=A0A1V2LTE8_PICKU|nr:hypothetical protein BOH78_0470 [Pichia kudriavzevii]
MVSKFKPARATGIALPLFDTMNHRDSDSDSSSEAEFHDSKEMLSQEHSVKPDLIINEGAELAERPKQRIFQPATRGGESKDSNRFKKDDVLMNALKAGNRPSHVLRSSSKRLQKDEKESVNAARNMASSDQVRRTESFSKTSKQQDNDNKQLQDIPKMEGNTPKFFDHEQYPEKHRIREDTPDKAQHYKDLDKFFGGDIRLMTQDSKTLPVENALKKVISKEHYSSIVEDSTRSTLANNEAVSEAHDEHNTMRPNDYESLLKDKLDKETQHNGSVSAEPFSTFDLKKVKARKRSDKIKLKKIRSNIFESDGKSDEDSEDFSDSNSANTSFTYIPAKSHLQTISSGKIAKVTGNKVFVNEELKLNSGSLHINPGGLFDEDDKKYAKPPTDEKEKLLSMQIKKPIIRQESENKTLPRIKISRKKDSKFIKKPIQFAHSKQTLSSTIDSEHKSTNTKSSLEVESHSDNTNETTIIKNELSGTDNLVNGISQNDDNKNIDDLIDEIEVIQSSSGSDSEIEEVLPSQAINLENIEDTQAANTLMNKYDLEIEHLETTPTTSSSLKLLSDATLKNISESTSRDHKPATLDRNSVLATPYLDTQGVTDLYRNIGTSDNKKENHSHNLSMESHLFVPDDATTNDEYSISMRIEDDEKTTHASTDKLFVSDEEEDGDLSKMSLNGSHSTCRDDKEYVTEGELGNVPVLGTKEPTYGSIPTGATTNDDPRKSRIEQRMRKREKEKKLKKDEYTPYSDSESSSDSVDSESDSNSLSGEAGIEGFVVDDEKVIYDTDTDSGDELVEIESKIEKRNAKKMKRRRRSARKRIIESDSSGSDVDSVTKGSNPKRRTASSTKNILKQLEFHNPGRLMQEKISSRTRPTRKSIPVVISLDSDDEEIVDEDLNESKTVEMPNESCNIESELLATNETQEGGRETLDGLDTVSQIHNQGTKPEHPHSDKSMDTSIDFEEQVELKQQKETEERERKRKRERKQVQEIELIGSDSDGDNVLDTEPSRPDNECLSCLREMARIGVIVDCDRKYPCGTCVKGNHVCGYTPAQYNTNLEKAMLSKKKQSKRKKRKDQVHVLNENQLAKLNDLLGGGKPIRRRKRK